MAEAIVVKPVNDDELEVIFEIPYMWATSPTIDITVRIDLYEEGKELCVFEIKDNGVSMSKTVSKYFSKGSLKVKSQDMEKVEERYNYKVKLGKVKKDIDLNIFQNVFFK